VNSFTQREQRVVSVQILSHHLTVVKVLVVNHFVNGHAVGLVRDVAHLVSFFGVLEHGCLAVVTGLVGRLAGMVEETTETGHANATENTEDVALVVVELGWGFSAEDEEVVAEEGLDAGQAEVCEAGAVVEESVNALDTLVRVRCLFLEHVRTARVRLVQ
jgi:hypothetical protein